MKHQNVKDLVLKLRQQFNDFQVNIPDELKANSDFLGLCIAVDIDTSSSEFGFLSDMSNLLNRVRC